MKQILALTCAISLVLFASPLDDARARLFAGNFEEAAKLYQQILDNDPTQAEPYYGLVRALLAAHRTQDAYAAADKALKNAPDSAAAQTAAGLATYRKGDLIQAERYFRAAIKLDSGYPGALQGLAFIYAAVSKFRSAGDLRLNAYARAPDDPSLQMAYASRLKGQAHIEALEKILASREPESADAKALRLHIDNDKAGSDKKLRRLASPYEATKLKLIVITNGVRQPRGLGIEVKVNGRYSAQLLFDTGASGISITPKLAEKAGLDSLGIESKAGGIGDDRSQTSYSYLASEISAGKVKFERYPVSAFHSAKDQDIDGLIGADVFGEFLVSIDFGTMEMTLEPRAIRPAESGEEPDATAIPAGFYRVYRFGNHLAVPTLLNDTETGLFLIDTGATNNLIDQQVARSVAKVHKDTFTTIRGIQGKVKDVQRADRVSLLFAGFHQSNSDLIAIDLANVSDSMGVALGGIIGMPVLGNLKMSIDYLNGAIKMELTARMK